jgi:TPR repeat protein
MSVSSALQLSRWLSIDSRRQDETRCLCETRCVTPEGDQEAERRLLEDTAAAGDTEAMVKLGEELERAGEIDAATFWYRQAAEGDDTVGMYNLGVMLEKADPEEAERLLRHSAGNGFARAMARLSWFVRESDREQAHFWAQRAVEATPNDTGAMVRLGVLLEETGEAHEAIPWYRQAAESGDAFGMYNFGRLLEQTDRGEAERWWLRAAELGSAPAMAGLAWFYQKSRPAESELWWDRAAMADYEPAILKRAADARRIGDRRSEIAWHEKGVALGNARAMFWLATLLDPYELGPDLPMKNHRRALSLLKRSAEMGDPYAQFLLGRQLTRWDPAGYWMRSDHLEEARALFIQAAEQGLPGPMVRLAGIAEFHDKDAAEVRHWLEQASDLGHIPATYMLAAKEPTSAAMRSLVDRAAELDGVPAKVVAKAVRLASRGAKWLRPTKTRFVRHQKSSTDPVEGQSRERHYVMATAQILSRVSRITALVVADNLRNARGQVRKYLPF